MSSQSLVIRVSVCCGITTHYSLTLLKVTGTVHKSGLLVVVQEVLFSLSVMNRGEVFCLGDEVLC